MTNENTNENAVQLMTVDLSNPLDMDQLEAQYSAAARAYCKRIGSGVALADARHAFVVSVPSNGGLSLTKSLSIAPAPTHTCTSRRRALKLHDSSVSAHTSARSATQR